MSKKLFKRQLSDDGYSIMVTRGESSAYQGPTDIIILNPSKDQNSISPKEFWLAILFCNNEPFAAPIDYHYPLQRTNHGNLLFFQSFRLLVLFLEHSGRWGEDWGRIDQTENPLVSPTLPLLLLDYPSRIWIPRKSTLPSLGSLYPELTNEFLTLGLLLRWLLKIITLNRDLSGTLFRTDTLAKKDQHKIICL